MASAVIASGIVYSDNFDRANTTAPGLGAAWNDYSSGFYISSNKATKNSGDHYAQFLQNLGSPDHWVEADVSGIGGGGGNYVVINARNALGSTANLYDAFIDPSGVPTIGKNVGGSFSTVATGSNVGTADCKLRLECQGTAVRLYRNGTLVASGTDSSVTTGNYCGVNAFAGSGGTAIYDNFRCGPLPYTP